MKTLNTYITEKFRVHKDVDYGPKSTTNDDIYNIVLDEVKKQAKRPQSASSPIDLNYIDVSKITSFFDKNFKLVALFLEKIHIIY